MKIVTYFIIPNVISLPASLKPTPILTLRSVCTPYCSDVNPNGEINDCSNRGNVNAANFLPYGEINGDTKGETQDDTYEGPLTMTNDVPYFGNSYNDLYISSNGIISFGAGMSGYTSDPFPISYKTFLSPFWSDFDTEIRGNWYYRKLSANDIDLASAIIRHENDAWNSFSGTEGVVATYADIAFYGGDDSDRGATVQAILIFDSTTSDSFAIYNYGDIEWTTGTASGGDRCTGLGGTQAQIGFNDGYGRYYAVPGSQTDAIININKRTNVKTTGRFVFKVDGATVEDPNPDGINQVVTTTTVTTETTTTTVTEPTYSISCFDAKSGIREILTALGYDVDLLSLHGRWASRVLGDQMTGSAVDELDEIFRSWHNKRKCILKINGACDNYNTASSDSYGLVEGTCAADNDSCQMKACEVDSHHINQVDDFMAQNPNWEPSEVESETPTFGTLKDSCCGDAVMDLKAYNSGVYVCTDGNLFEI